MQDLMALAECYPELTVSIKLSDLMTFGRSITDELLAAIGNAQAAVQAPTDDLLTRKEVMQLLGISPATLWRWKKSGYLLPVRIGSLDRYRRSTLDKVINRKDTV